MWLRLIFGVACARLRVVVTPGLWKKGWEEVYRVPERVSAVGLESPEEEMFVEVERSNVCTVYREVTC